MNDLDAGMAHLRAGRWQEGIERLRAVLAREPKSAEVWSNLGFALRATGQAAEAREALQRAVALRPQLADAWNLLGLVEQESDRHEDAWRHFDRAIALRLDFAFAWMNRANSEQALGRIDAALAGYARALELAPASGAIHYNLGHLHQKVTARLDEALRSYREAIRLEPGLADAHLNLAHVLLLLGRFDEGWREFAWRPQRRLYAAARARLGVPYEPPRAEPWPRRLAVRAEQGLGDILFFLRYAAEAAARGTELAFNGDARLHPLLARTGLFVRLSDDPAVSSSDGTEILAGDLPLLFPDLHAAGALPPPFRLPVDAGARERMAERLAAAGPRPWIALTWRAGERSAGLFDRLFKEAPIAAFGALREMAATWISVQRAPMTADSEALESALGAPLHDFSAINADLDSALAAMDLVDEYVGVSNTNMHLRAGVGHGARVLVPFTTEWRWGAQGQSPWFPAMTTYREAPRGDWSNAFAALARDLATGPARRRS